MKFRSHRSDHQGFALIITISMMILLALLAVGLLSLSTVALRSSSSGSAIAEAQANARMALMIAIGDLQKELGPDRRISARASLVLDDPSEPNLVGAWESWAWDPQGAGSPDYTAKKDRFNRWLVSSPDPENPKKENLPASTLKDPVWLINPATSGGSNTPGPSLRASLVNIADGSDDVGRFAYAVMDESLKASINLPEIEAQDTAEEIAFRTAPSRENPEMLVEALDPESIGDPARLISLPTAVVAAGESKSAEILGHQHELTTRSLSLLTNVVDGGFKKDLTTAFESKAKLSNLFGNDAVYFSENDGAPSWDYLRSHYQHYQNVKNASSGNPSIELGSRELRPGRRGTDPFPSTERLMPVIAKLQIVFSIVTHYSHISDRVNFFDTKGEPKGNNNYGAPHLAYDPVVTLYNPYDIAIELDKLRVRIWDPPVLFGFKKNDNWLRDEHASGDFHGLARFQITNEKNPKARKSFTLLLRDLGSADRPGKAITLQPGEVKVFSPWVEEDWDWALETKGGYAVRAFFDWDQKKDFGNQDGRTANTFGIETVPGWDARAGLQTDHLSYATRPKPTRYPFEIKNNWDGGWLGINILDTFSVISRPGRTAQSSGAPDFAVDLLAARTQAPERDLLRSYSFRFADIESELSGSSSTQEIERTFRVGDLLQTPDDPSPGGKSPFAILTMSAKTTVDPKDVSMPWLHNHPVTEGVEQDTNIVGNALDTYDVRFEEMQDFNTFPGVEFDSDTKRGFYGASATANRGVSNVPMFRIPLIPASSLGDLIPANLSASSQLPRVTHPLGSSRAHPLIPSGAISRKSPVANSGQFLDHAYLMNDALWDDTFFSTAASFSAGLTPSTNRSALLSDFLAGEQHLLNPRLVPLVSTDGTPKEQASRLDGLSDEDLTNQMAGSMAITGGFNVNCDSVDAWRAMLGSLRGEAVRGWNLGEHASKGKSAFPRASLPLGGDAEESGNQSVDVQGQVRWAGFRALDDAQIQDLAEAIVVQLRKRGSTDKAPNLSLAEFVNRRPGQSSGLHALAGLLEEAIRESGINDDFHQLDSKNITGNETLTAGALNGLAEPDARIGMTGEGAPSIVTQGDLLMQLAPVITVRGDTFRIRAYGESSKRGGIPGARAWCEAVVQRLPEYLDPEDDPELAEADLKNEMNQLFGRRFIMTSFRWLSSTEI